MRNLPYISKNLMNYLKNTPRHKFNKKTNEAMLNSMY